MPQRDKSEIDRLAEMVDTEINVDSNELAKRLKPDMVQPGEEMPTEAFLAYVASRWNDPAYRAALHEKVGDKAIIDIANKVIPRVNTKPTAPPPGGTVVAPDAAGPSVNPAPAEPPPIAAPTVQQPQPAGPAGGPALPPVAGAQGI